MKYVMILLLLTGCQRATVIDNPVIVKLPVPVSCHARIVAPPDWNTVRLKRNATPVQQLQAILADMDLGKGYIETLEAQLKACS